MKRIKLFSLLVFAGIAIVGFSGDGRVVQFTDAFSAGPPPGHTGAPGESTCTVCHTSEPGASQFTINAPQNYVPGQTYPIVVQHVTSDGSRMIWGFQLTALAGTTRAGTLVSINAETQVMGASGRTYIEHTSIGNFAGQQGGAVWTFTWTAPPTNVGVVRFYSAGNQGDNDGTSGGDRILVTNASSQPPAVATVRSPFDFDGDGKTDFSIFRPLPGEWWMNRSSDNQTFAAQFGAGTDTITPADYTGDGKADIAFWRPSDGFWYVLRSEDFSFFAFPFGSNGDIPVPADYDNDAKADAAVFRPSTNLWFIRRTTDGGTTIQQFGIAGDRPVAADYDGDGRADIGIFRPNGTNGAEWWIDRSTAGLLASQFGVGTDRTGQGDYTGDGKADVAFWRPADGFWYVLRSEDFSFFAVPFGTTGDVPVSGDYDGDGKTDRAVFRPSTSTWFADRSTAGVIIQQFGVTGDLPLPSAYVR